MRTRVEHIYGCLQVVLLGLLLILPQRCEAVERGVFPELSEEFPPALREDYDRRVAAINEATLPATPEDLVQWYPEPPEDKNAIAEYRFAMISVLRMIERNEHGKPYDFSGRKLPVLGIQPLPTGGEAMSDEMKTSIAHFMEAQAVTYSSLKTAAAMNVYRHPEHFFASLEAVQAEARHELDENAVVKHPKRALKGMPAHMRGATNLLILESIYQAELGNQDEAVARTLDTFKLCKDLLNSPFMDSVQMETACRELTLSNLAYLLGRYTFSDAQLVQLGKALEDFEFNDAILHSFYSEKLPIGRAASENQLHYLWLDEAEENARTRMARLALAIERYRIANKGFPENLATLAPDFIKTIPVDPLDLPSFRFEISENGYILYGVGYEIARRLARSKVYRDVSFTVAR